MCVYEKILDNRGYNDECQAGLLMSCTACIAKRDTHVQRERAPCKCAALHPAEIHKQYLINLRDDHVVNMQLLNRTYITRDAGEIRLPIQI